MRYVLALCALLCLPVSARATPTRIQDARAAAKAVWGPNVCGDTDAVAVVNRPLPFPRIGQAEWDGVSGGVPYDCRVVFAAGFHFDWNELCILAEHEFGHLAGYRAPAGHEARYADGQLDPFHSDNPNSVMAPQYDDQHNRHCDWRRRHRR